MKIGEIKIEALKLMFANSDDQLTIDNRDNASGEGTEAPGDAVLDLHEAQSDPKYKDYLNNMNGAINRCLSVLEARKVLPKKCASIWSEDTESRVSKKLEDIGEGSTRTEIIGLVGLSSGATDANILKKLKLADMNTKENVMKLLELEESAPKAKIMERRKLSEFVSDLDDIQRVVLQGENRYVPFADFFVEGEYLVIPFLMFGDTVRLIYYPRLSRVTSGAADMDELAGLPDKIACLIPYYVKYELFREDSESEANSALNYFESALSQIDTPTEGYQGSVDRLYTMNWRE